MSFADAASGFPERVSRWNRGRKWRCFEQSVELNPATTILDVGFSASEGRSDDNYLEKHYLHLDNVTALTIEDPRDSEERYPGLTVVRYDGGRMPFEDGQFDVVWSNAVVEHVGEHPSRVAFLKELDRVGRTHFVTTPNRWFPAEVHTRTPFLHWLPSWLFYRYLHACGLGKYADGYMWLLSRRTFTRALVEAGIDSFRLVRNRIGPTTLDFVAIW